MMNISTRKTIRKYTQQPISDELLNRLLEEASHTQTMGNLQGGVLTYRRQKTSQQLHIKWEPAMQEIVAKYMTDDSPYLLPIAKGEGAVFWKQYKNI